MHIPQPCYENWSAMTPAPHGRVCASCNSLVADMTQLSNEEILALIGKGVHCGRFYENQLQTPPTRLGGLAQWFGKLRKQWAIAAMLTLAELGAPAESEAKSGYIEQIEKGRTDIKGDTGLAMPGIIQGAVLKGTTAVYGVPDREVFVYANKRKCLGSVTTDENGLFAFTIPPGNLSDSFTLVLKGYRKKNRYWKTHYHRVEATWVPGDPFIEIYEKATSKKRLLRRRPVVTGRFRMDT